MNLEYDLVKLLSIGATALHLLGIASAVQAIMKARTPQGATAWAVALVAFPYVSLPLFWIFGRDRFQGYRTARAGQDLRIGDLRRLTDVSQPGPVPEGVDACLVSVLEDLADMPFTSGNTARLCIDGDATFAAIFEAIERAQKYLLVQFFIVHDDELGRSFQQKLIDAAGRGVKIYFLYDDIGSHDLPKKYLARLSEVGIEVRSFKNSKGAKNRFQINFRNHRKIVIGDGRIALIGGHNVGDEYLGKSKVLGPWRDTHVRIEGPAAAQTQISFCEDWHWSTGKVPPDLVWSAAPAVSPGKAAIVLPSGPADGLDTCCLFFLQMIHSAKKRVWITSPYFVPDPQIVSALQLAAMRGVDVRVILPNKADHLMVYLASFSYLKDALPWNVKLYRYQAGFIHEKVLLVDDNVAAVGTANFDNRSFRLNFEITAIFADREFAREVEAMLVEDLRNSRAVAMSEIDDRSYFFKTMVQVARLFAPVL